MQDLILSGIEALSAIAVCLMWIQSMRLELSKEQGRHSETLEFYRECQKEQMLVLDRHIDNEQRQL